MANQQDWDIKKRGHACHKTETDFKDGQVIYSRLIFAEEEYAREDYSEEGWESLEDKSALSVWQGKYQAPPPPDEEAVKKETVESMLRKLIETEDDSQLNTMYILAVMLERKRILVEQDVQTREDGVKVRIYEHKKSGESFVIRDPELKLSELGPVQDEVAVKLGAKPRAPEEDESGEEPEDEEEEFDDEDEEDEK